MQLYEIIFLINLISTLIMVGMIWVVQIVNYPLFARVGKESFEHYHQGHFWRISGIVALPMLCEAFSTMLMLWFPHPALSLKSIWLGVGLIFVIWISTLFFQVPCHGKLAKGFDQRAYKFIIWTNWIRTLAWTFRGILVLIFLISIIHSN